MEVGSHLYQGIFLPLKNRISIHKITTFNYQAVIVASSGLISNETLHRQMAVTLKRKARKTAVHVIKSLHIRKVVLCR